MRPVKEKLPLSLMVGSWMGSLLLVSLVFFYQHSQYTQISETLKKSSLELKVSKIKLKQLETRHADYKPSPQLMTKLDRLSQELNGKRFLSQHLKGNAIPQEKKYSQVMIDLGRLHSNELWVTKMRFDEEGVFLKGFALDALAVPKWLNGLQQSPFFSGKSFALMNLKNDKQNLITFEINTVATQELGDEEKLAAIKALAGDQ
jgi:MSHA biogenesis protein MshI